ncbi:hypothetical protein [Lysobacter solisilvae (ex Woo and Kim 2020)]|uniref:Uncharacterized protein n=1 Tax=Agrilutibacter terrestris TaxID=2865112 RepID=A0A7H0FU99_9GAMM|nr:hypothetical protein [Lysobacter terrestris]QNP39615.1 hypothetical protein H8B22_08730 [Lysobacter terrestris]
MSYRRAWMCCAFIVLAGCAPSPAETSNNPPAPADTAAPVADSAATPPQPGSDAAGDPATTELARISANPNAKPGEVSQYLSRFFRDECGKDDGLPFEQVCRHYATDADTSDPSPWPDLMLGLAGDRIVSAVLFDSAQNLGNAWACAPVKGLEHVRACAPTIITSTQRDEWLQRWSAYLNAAD